MTDKTKRRALQRAWREREVIWVILSVSVGAMHWVTLTPDTRASVNRLGFTLRQGSAVPVGMQAAWEAAGRPELETAVLEELDPELSAMARETEGQARLENWAERLGARIF